MAFEVLISPSALVDAEDYVAFIRLDRKQPLGAERWWNGLLEAIFSLPEGAQSFLSVINSETISVI